MGSNSSKTADNRGENEPLLPQSENRIDDDEATAFQKFKRALARNAVIIAIISLLTAVVILLCVFFGIETAKTNKPKTSVCTSAACVHAASEILYNLSPNYKDVDPCTDFEELVCGGWDERHDLRPDQGDAFTGTIMSETSQTLLRHILEAPYPDDSDHSAFSPANIVSTLSSVDRENFNKLKGAYDACMDEDTIKKDGVEPLMEILHQVARRFPINVSLKHHDDLADTTLYLAKLGISSLISLGVGADDKYPDNVVISVFPPRRIGLPSKEYYKDSKVVKQYEDTLTQVADALHPSNKSRADARDLIGFEKELAAASPDAEDADDVTKYYNPRTLKEVDEIVPEIQISKIIDSLAPSRKFSDRIIVASPSYLKALSKLIKNTPRETLQSYFVWKTIQAFATEVESDALKPYSRFRNELQGKDPDSTPERWRICVSHVDDGLGWILSRFFVEKAFSAKAKDFGDQIVSDIKEMFIETLKVTEWMDKSVIELAINKVHNIAQLIGYPTKSPDIMDPPSLKDYYSSLSISTDKFFENALQISKFDVKREWDALGKPVDRDQWGMTVPTVNAYYDPAANLILFPGGIMQFPVFDVNVPQYLSYGAFGSVSGHELSHAFDSTGRHYDENGTYTDWWTDATVKGFKKRADCFVDQYSNYTVPGPDNKALHVNGRLTLGENIADAGGLSASFSAWQKRRKETPNDDLPGLEHFSQEQLFFVAYGNWWCGKSRKETAISHIYTDPHAPKFARILGTMANSRDFKDAFQCQKREPVCELW